MAELAVKPCDGSTFYSVLNAIADNLTGRIVWTEPPSFIAEMEDAYYYCHYNFAKGKGTLVILPRSLVDAEVVVENGIIAARVRDEVLVALERAALATLDTDAFSMLLDIDVPKLGNRVWQVTLRNLRAYVAVRAATSRLRAIAEIVVGPAR